MINSFKLLDLNKVKIGKTAIFCVVAILIGLAVALPVTLYFQYNQGSDRGDIWANGMVPKMPFNNVAFIKQRLKAQGTEIQAEKISGWGRFSKIMPNKACMISLGVGMFLVLLFVFMRIRFAKWPLHPILFLVWSTHPGQRFYFSFLLGWVIKSIIMKYGGIRLYRKLKPFVIGLIAGELLGHLCLLL